MKDLDPKYLVCVQCMTFNQSQYIIDTLNGFVMQRTKFPFVIIIVDDASTDGEQTVIRNFISEQFDIADTTVAYEKETDYAHITYAQHSTNQNCYIAAIYLKENHYSKGKSKFSYLSDWRDNVKYEALCEGDDYWIDPLKLQKQVDFLERNPEYVMSHTSVDYLYMNVNRIIPYKDIEINTPLNIEGKVLLEDILTKYRVQTLSVVYRKDIYNKIIESDTFLYRGAYFLMGDTQLWFGFARLGKIHFLPEVTCIYRRNPNSVSNQTDLKKQKRFSLSSAEMRYYISLNYDLKKETKKKIKDKYENALLRYWRYDPLFRPKFPIEIKNIVIKQMKVSVEDTIFNLLRRILAKPRKMLQKSI